jgi:DNA-binding transcriptional LysR family regulator
MSLTSIDLNLLVALTALLEEGNVTHAGLKVGMSQPAMSGALGRLRRHFKDDLLVRVGREYELTPLARQLLPSARESLRLVEFALGLTRDFDPAVSDRTFRFALSDYAITVINKPLMSLVQELAPDVKIDFGPLYDDAHLSLNGLLAYDFLVAPLGYGFRGESEVLFKDRFVVVADPRNERIKNGAVTMKDLVELPHAVASFGTSMTPIDRMLDEMGIRRPVHVTARGWLPVPFAVAGTDLVSLVPERLARRVAGTAGVTVLEPPFGRVELVDAIWWHPTRSTDAGHGWLRSVLHTVTLGLAADRSTGDLGRPEVLAVSA